MTSLIFKSVISLFSRRQQIEWGVICLFRVNSPNLLILRGWWRLKINRIFLHKLAITKLLYTCDAILKLLASKLRKIAKFPYFFGENSNFGSRRIDGRISKNFDRIHLVIGKPSVQKLCLRTLLGRNYGPSKFKK